MKGSPIRPSTREQVKTLCLTPKYLLSLLLGNIYDDDVDDDDDDDDEDKKDNDYDGDKWKKQGTFT